MIFVRYKTGRKLQGVLLALGDQSIRIAIQGEDDAVQFRLVRGVWVSEDCEVVTFEFAEIAAQDQTDVPEAIIAAEFGAPVVQRII
jgi:hypothetical protein